MTRITYGCVVTGSEDGCWTGSGTTLLAETGVEVLLKGGKKGVWSWLAENWLPEVLEKTR
jgi:hypothetical protein